MAEAHHSDIEIARQLGLSAVTVGRKRRALGIAPGLPRRLRIVIARGALRMARDGIRDDSFIPIVRLARTRRKAMDSGSALVSTVTFFGKLDAKELPSGTPIQAAS
jgi:hypothetical protein